MRKTGESLSPHQIRKLAERHGEPPFCARDKALIALAGMSYFTASDLSLVAVRELVTERGAIVEHGYLPPSYSSSGKPKLFVIGRGTFLESSLKQVIAWRIDQGLGLLDRGLYSGLDPESRFFLKDSGEPFPLTYKQRNAADTATQALAMQRHFQRFFLSEGVSLRSLNEGFIQAFWSAKCSQGTAQAIRDLMELTGLTAETLRSKCLKEETSVQEILETLYR